MAFALKEKVFGEVKAFVRVINSQKRDLPHAHCIFFPMPKSKNIYHKHLSSTLLSLQRFLALPINYFVKSSSNTTCTIFVESSTLHKYVWIMKYVPKGFQNSLLRKRGARNLKCTSDIAAVQQTVAEKQLHGLIAYLKKAR